MFFSQTLHDSFIILFDTAITNSRRFYLGVSNQTKLSALFKHSEDANLPLQEWQLIEVSIEVTNKPRLSHHCQYLSWKVQFSSHVSKLMSSLRALVGSYLSGWKLQAKLLSFDGWQKNFVFSFIRPNSLIFFPSRDESPVYGILKKYEY